MSTVEYNGIPMEQTTETNYNYNVGGEVKKTVPFTKELREWLLMFKSRGIRFADTIDELRLFTKHENKQMFGVIENGSIYQYQLVTTPDDGENTIMPENVFSYNTGRWVKVLSFSNEIVSLWSQMQYIGVWGNNPLPISSTDTIFYINNQSGIDSDINDGSITNPFKTIGYAINRFGVTQNYWNGLLTLNITSDYTEPISILNYFNSNLIINFGNYDISAIEMYGNGNITLSGGGEIGVLKSMLNQNISVDLSTFDTKSDISFTNDYNVTISSCFVREKIRIHDCKGTVQLGGLTIYPPYYVDLLRCKAHVSSIDGDIRANYCFITRTLAPYIYGSHNVISDMDAFNDIFIPTTEQELVNNATTLGVIDLYAKAYVRSITCPNLVSCDVIMIYQAKLYSLSLYELNCLYELNLPLLQTTKSIGINGTAITSLDLPTLETAEKIDITGNLELESIDLSALENLSISITARTNTNLTSILISESINCLFINFSSNALTQTCVDDILDKVDTAGYEDGILFLGGDTNAIPSAGGLVSKSNLEGKGWTVTVNT